MSAEAAIRKPAHLVESGPAAGVVACAFLARATGIPNVISLDMGGTTAKAAILEDGQPVKTSEYEVGAGINLSSRLDQGRRLRDPAPVHRPLRDRRGRRQPRLGGRVRDAARRPRERRRRPGAGLLRPGRRRADADRRPGRARLPEPRVPGGRDGRDRCGRGCARARVGGGAARPGRDRGRLRRLPARRRDDDASGRRRSRPTAAGIRATSCSAASAATGRSSRPRSRARCRCAACSCRSRPASSARPACSCPRSSTSSCGR